MHGEDVQRNTRPVFQGHKRDGGGGKKARRKVQVCLDGTWELWGEEAEAQGQAEAGEGIFVAQEWRGCAAELGHAECQASRTRMAPWGG